MPDCFVIMPISTPDHLVAKYNNDEDHFIHVYEHLFKPAIEKIELTPISPRVAGSDIIQGEIIKRLDEAHLVLCDMSILNANVFFEFGIRTALNKPVCLVKDDLTTKVPFDTSIINNHTYKSKLEPWDLDDQITTLSEHISESLKRSEDSNSLWKYFGLSVMAKYTKPEEGEKSALQYLTMQIEAMRRGFESRSNIIAHGKYIAADNYSLQLAVAECAKHILGTANIDIDATELDDRSVSLRADIKVFLDEDIENKLEQISILTGVQIEVRAGNNPIFISDI